MADIIRRAVEEVAPGLHTRRVLQASADAARSHSNSVP